VGSSRPAAVLFAWIGALRYSGGGRHSGAPAKAGNPPPIRCDEPNGEADRLRCRPETPGRRLIWWAHQDSNLEPKDSLTRKFPSGADYLFTRDRSRLGAGRSSLLSRALEPSGSLCTFRRCTAGLAQGCHRPNREGFPEFIPIRSARYRAVAPFRWVLCS